MTREEAIAQLKRDRDLCNFNPMTGEEEPMNEDCRKSVEALDLAIKAIERQSDGWLARHRDEILKAGMEGREFVFRIDGRLFAIREKAQ